MATRSAASDQVGRYFAAHFSGELNLGFDPDGRLQQVMHAPVLRMDRWIPSSPHFVQARKLCRPGLLTTPLRWMRTEDSGFASFGEYFFTAFSHGIGIV